MLCKLNLYMSGGTLQYKTDSERHMVWETFRGNVLFTLRNLQRGNRRRNTGLRTTDFWEAFHGNFICSQSSCQKSAEKKSPKKYFHILVLLFNLTSNKPTHYLLDYGYLQIGILFHSYCCRKRPLRTLFDWTNFHTLFRHTELYLGNAIMNIGLQTLNYL